jgi:hypothetical protein
MEKCVSCILAAAAARTHIYFYGLPGVDLSRISQRRRSGSRWQFIGN